MHADGVMVKLDYSDEEYAEMEKAIAHDEDLKYPHFFFTIHSRKICFEESYH